MGHEFPSFPEFPEFKRTYLTKRINIDSRKDFENQSHKSKKKDIDSSITDELINQSCKHSKTNCSKTNSMKFDKTVPKK